MEEWRNTDQAAFIATVAGGISGTPEALLGGYFCAMVGAVDEATIKACIENQKWDEDDQGFKITAPPILEPAVSRGFFRRLQPLPRLSVAKESTGFSR